MNSLLGNYTRAPVVFEKGQGVWLTDTEGKRYLDLLAGIAVSCLGHNHPALTAAIADQAGDLLHVSNLFYSRRGLEAADEVAGLFGLPGKVFFCNSGTESVEAAIKLARKFAWRSGESEKIEVVVLRNSFHGRTYGSLAATMQPAKQAGFGPLPAGFIAVETVHQLEEAVRAETAAVLIELIQGEAGVYEVSCEFARRASELATEHNALLITDEIQTGFGRTGRWWCFDHYDIQPDVVCTAKGLGGGFPTGAMWVSDEFANGLQPGDHGTTVGGGPLASAAICAVIDTIKRDQLVANAGSMGLLLSELLKPLGESVRGRGLLLALELGRPIAAQVAAEALEAGVIVNAVTESAVRVAPPLIITEDEIREGVNCLSSVLSKRVNA